MVSLYFYLIVPCLCYREGGKPPPLDTVGTLSLGTSFPPPLLSFRPPFTLFLFLSSVLCSVLFCSVPRCLALVRSPGTRRGEEDDTQSVTVLLL